MAVWTVALILLAGAGFILWLRLGNSENTKAKQSRIQEVDPVRIRLRLRPQLERLYLDGRYWGVRIEPGDSGELCTAARKIADRRFGFEGAPPLPLPDCSITQCSCRYAGLEEQRRPPPRRQNADRRDKIRYEPKRGSRRQERDRRKLSKWDDQGNL